MEIREVFLGIGENKYVLVGFNFYEVRVVLFLGLRGFGFY